MTDSLLPQELNRKTFHSILTKEFKQEVEILDIQVDTGSTKGDHHLSEINRIKVKYILKGVESSKSFIFKDVTKGVNEFVSMVKGIEKETSWYDKIQPKIADMNINFGAVCYKIHKDWFLVDDLCQSGYKIVDRMSLLDLEHCKQAVAALAKFHATTHHLLATDNLPDVAKQETLLVQSNETSLYKNFLCFDEIASNLAECGGKKYSPILIELKQKTWKKMMHCLEQDYGFKCLVHADYWTTNILFNHDENGKASDAKIIDFQLIKVSIPVYDLHFFISTSMRPDVRDNYLDEILQVYLNTLNSTLKQIGSQTQLSQDVFLKMFEETYFIGLFFSLNFLPIPLCDVNFPLELSPPDSYTEEERKLFNPLAKVYKQTKYREHLLSLLEFYHKKNIL